MRQVGKPPSHCGICRSDCLSLIPVSPAPRLIPSSGVLGRERSIHRVFKAGVNHLGHLVDSRFELSERPRSIENLSGYHNQQIQLNMIGGRTIS